jgi:hypothetical protein
MKKCLEFLRDDRGDFGIKEIAMAVAGVVIIGVIVTAVSGFLPTWIEDIWGIIKTYLQGWIPST